MIESARPRRFPSAAKRPAPPGSGPLGGVQRALLKLLADQIAPRHSCTHTTGWLSPCLPSESCKSRKSVSRTQNTKWRKKKNAFSLISFGAMISRFAHFILSFNSNLHYQLCSVHVRRCWVVRFPLCWTDTGYILLFKGLRLLQRSISLRTQICKYTHSKLGWACSTV